MDNRELQQSRPGPVPAMSAIIVYRQWLQPALYWGSAMASALRILLLEPDSATVRARL